MKKIILELQINDDDEQKLIDFLLKEKLKHNFYTFSIGSLGTGK